MRIIKKGRMPVEERNFECPNCGTIFVAERGEWRNESIDAKFHFWTIHTAICPVCRKEVRNEVQDY